MTKRSNLLAACALVLAVGAPRVAQADDRGDKYAAMVVQNRQYRARHELTGYFGTLPLDAFTKGITLSGSYTMHFSDLWAWEVIHGFESFHVNTSLRDKLEPFGAQETPFEILNRYVTSNIVFKPVYWKGAWLNDKMLHGEIFLVAGGGYGWWSRSQLAAVDYGIGLRFFLHKHIWVRLDIRHDVFFNDSIFDNLDLRHEIWAGLGASLAF